MKTYAELFAATKEVRVAELKESVEIAIHMADAKTILQKVGGKIIAAMKIAGDIGDREISKYGSEITGHDIRKELQNVYELANVMEAIILEKIDLTEADYEKIGASKLAYLSPLLSDKATESDRDKIPEAVAMLKADKPAREISEFTRGKSAEPKAVKEQRERADKAEAETAETKKVLKSMFENGTPVPVGFMATDIGREDPLVNSKQFKGRVMADLKRAMEVGDETAAESMKEFFGKVFDLCCRALGENATDAMASMAGSTAKAAAGKVVEIEALETAAA